MDNRGRTPFLFCLANIDRIESTKAVEYMLQKQKDLVNRYDGEYSPLHALAERSNNIDTQQGQANAAKCLRLFMEAEPNPTADLISALQGLPEWLMDEAFNLRNVQSLLNQKISQPFPTAVLMLDFYMLLVMLIVYSYRVSESIRLRSDSDPTNDAVGGFPVIPLYLGAIYFSARELSQFLGVSSLGAQRLYFTDLTNLLDICFITLIVYTTIRIHTGTGDSEQLRVWFAVTAGITWANILIYLTNVIIDLAVFTAGVVYVLRQLGAFVVATTIILLAFTQMFATVFRETEICRTAPLIPDSLNDIRCGTDNVHNYCNLWSAFFRVFTMMLGEVDSTEFDDSSPAMSFFIVFFFLVVILLANLLIAIVTDSYSIVRNERAAIVFWANRLDFVAEMDAIAHSPWTRSLERLFSWKRKNEPDHDPSVRRGRTSTLSDGGDHHRNYKKQQADNQAELDKTTMAQSTFGSESWNAMMSLFDDENDEPWYTCDAVGTLVVRILVAYVVLPLWVLCGAITFGILWPPQIREFVFIEAIANFTGSTLDGDSDRVRDTGMEVGIIEDEIMTTREHFQEELATERAGLNQIKTQLSELRIQLTTEARSLKRAMAKHIEEQARRQNEQGGL